MDNFINALETKVNENAAIALADAELQQGNFDELKGNFIELKGNSD